MHHRRTLEMRTSLIEAPHESAVSPHFPINEKPVLQWVISKFSNSQFLISPFPTPMRIPVAYSEDRRQFLTTTSSQGRCSFRRYADALNVRASSPRTDVAVRHAHLATTVNIQAVTVDDLWIRQNCQASDIDILATEKQTVPITGIC